MQFGSDARGEFRGKSRGAAAMDIVQTEELRKKKKVNTGNNIFSKNKGQLQLVAHRKIFKH